MRNLLIRFIANAAALWIAAYLVAGIRLGSDGVVDVGALAVVALIFGLVNAFIRPIVKLATCPFYVLTLGLFTFVVNAGMLWLTGWLSGGRLAVDGFWPALLGGVVIGLVSFAFSMLLGEED